MTRHLRKGMFAHFLYLLRSLPVPACYCGNYSQCITSQLNRPSFCVYSQEAQCARMLSSNRKTYPAPFVIPPVHWKRLQWGRKEGGKKKSMLSNAEIGKCHFDKCKALCTHRLNFDGSLPRRGLLFLFIGLHIKMLNNDVTEGKYKCHWQENVPQVHRRFFIIYLFIYYKRRWLINALLKGHGAIFSATATKHLYFDMACHAVFAWGNQCKFICISSNRSLSILPSVWCS